jgi:serine/threonine protein kinase
MTPEEWQRVRPILESALELDSAHRPAYLDGACADRSLRREVESLIAVHEQAGTGFLSSAPVSGFLAEDEKRFRLLPGKRIGVYEIEEEIAVGGMGAVYRAIRADGQYQQRVALKIVRSELGAESTATRFRNERQILASLDHPNIAKILDGSTTADGLPYFVMEFIDGLPITAYCDQHKLTIDERLKVFRTVCSAVHYAHQHLVIHRDLKPGNILVTSDGVPKLLDFGIAKILDPSLLAESAAATLAGLWVMTPEYASPEQLRGEAITTATDVYSLGLVLYELLAGRSAYRLAGHLPHEIARAVLETDPEKPSTAIRRKGEIAEKGQEKAPLTPELISGLRADSLEKLQGRLAGDLDNIMLKAIRKDARERYSSADQLSEDIRRHLEHVPVLARKSTVVYRCRQYVLRHKVGVTAAALIFLSLLTGLALTLREARIAHANELRAERRFNEVRKIANSLLFDVHDSIQTLQGATSARKLIIQLGLEYLDGLSAESAADPSLEKELAAAYQKLGDVQAGTTLGNVGDRAGGIASCRKAVKLREELSRQFPRDWSVQNELAKSYIALARGLLVVGNQVESHEYVEKAFQIARPLAEQHPDNSNLLYTLGSIEWHRASSLWRLAETEAALQAFKESAETFSRVIPLEPANKRARRSVAVADKSAGGALEELKRLDEALHSYRLAFNIDQQLLAQEPESAMYLRDSTVDLRNLGDVSVKQKRLKEARKYYTNAMAIDQRLVERDPADRDTQFYLALDHEGIGKVLLEMRDARGAVASLQASQKIHQERTKADPADADAKDVLADNYVLIGDAYMALAQSTPQSLRNANLQNGCTAYSNALRIWNAMQAAGALNKLSETHRSSLLAKIQNCN